MVSAKKSRVNSRRAKEMRVSWIYQNAADKAKILGKVLRKFKLDPEEVCAVADDLIDIPLLAKVGLAVGVANSVEEVKTHAHYVTQKEGGRGAVREVVELILKVQNRWEEITRRTFS